MEAGAVPSGDWYSFEGEQLAPAGHLYSQMPMCQVLQHAIKTPSIELARDIANSLIPNLMLMHMMGCAHNDLKPGNVMSVDGRTWLAADYGIVEPWHAGLYSFYRHGFGTPSY